MGNSTTKDSEMEIKVGTLNYSGILLSPYQFFEIQDQTEIQLSEKMKNIYDKGTVNYQFGPLDKHWQQKRFSPLYLPTCGIKNNVNLFSKRQFFQQWDTKARQNDKVIQNFLDDDEKNRKRQYLNNLKNFDYLIYRSMLETIYTLPQQIAQLKKIDSDLFQLDAKKYKQSRKKMFRKPFLNEDQKIVKTISMIQKFQLDVLFLQQANLKLVAAIQKKYKNLRIVRSWSTSKSEMPAQSVIIIKQNKEKFPKFKNLLQQNKVLTGNTVWLKNSSIQQVKLTKDDFKRLNFNGDTVIQCLYNIILISTHLSSKPEKQLNGIQLLQQRLFFLKNKFPECHIILGGDLNSQNVARLFKGERKQIEAQKKLKNQGYKIDTTVSDIVLDNQQREHFNRIFNIMPKVENSDPDPNRKKKKLFTVNKKRTFTQCQPKKGGQLKQVTIDYFISDLQIRDVKVRTLDQQIDFEKPSKLLPSSNHPYDHYLLTATILLKDKLKHTTDLDYKFKYTPSLLTKQQLQEVNNQFMERINKQMQKFKVDDKFLKKMADRQERYQKKKIQLQKKQIQQQKKKKQEKQKAQEESAKPQA